MEDGNFFKSTVSNGGGNSPFLLNKDMEEKGWVYCWVNLVNGKRRVGHTIEFDKRIRSHINDSKNGKYPLHNAIRKYGLQNFVIESIEVNKEEMFWLERMWKIIYKTTDPEYGYDLMIDEDDISGRNNPMWGRKHSKKSIEKNRLSNIGKQAGEKNARARKVLLVSPDKISIELPCYQPFCKENGLNVGHISEVLQGKRNHHKGWTGRYI